MPATAFLRKFSTPMTVSHESFNVAPALLGAPLARPWRRAAAIAVDFAVIGMVTSVSGMWMVGLAALLAFRLRRRAASMTVRRMILLGVGIAVLLWNGVPSVLRNIDVIDGKAKVVKAAVKEADDDGEDIAKAATAAGVQSVNTACITELEKVKKEVKQPQPKGAKEMLGSLIDLLGISLGWAAAYFSLLPSRWRGQTLGKRLFGLRVVELTGKPLTTLHCFNRYGGYAAGMATGLLGFAQVLWDDNRQAIHDKIAHTVVIDARGDGGPIAAE